MRNIFLPPETLAGIMSALSKYLINWEHSSELPLRLTNEYVKLFCATTWLEKTLLLGKIEDRRGRGSRGWDGWMASQIQGTWVREAWHAVPVPQDREAWHAEGHGVTNSRIQLSNWTTILMVLNIGVGFPGGSDGKEPACSSGDPDSIPGLGRSPGKGNGNPLQYSCLENPMDKGAWQATVHGVAKSWTWLSNQHTQILV